jgi:hypothetical protein
VSVVVMTAIVHLDATYDIIGPTNGRPAV